MSAPERLDLLTAELRDAPAVERVQLTRITLAPGQAAGGHRHPCDVVGSVLSGSIRFQLEGSAAVVLHAGDAFVEPRGAHVLHFDNDADRPASFLACYLLAAEQEQLIVMDGDWT